MLSKLAESDDFTHILFYGPSGSGKRTLTTVHLPSYTAQMRYIELRVNKRSSKLAQIQAPLVQRLFLAPCTISK